MAVAATVIAVAVGTVTAAIAWSDQGIHTRSSTQADTRSTIEPNARTTIACQPWSECSPDAAWLRRVIRRAGLGKVGPGTGSALVIPGVTPTSARHLWAVQSAGQTDPVYQTYRALPEVDGVPIYTDGTRLLWQAQGRNVYLAPPPEQALLARLVRLTIRVEAPMPHQRTSGAPAA